MMKQFGKSFARMKLIIRPTDDQSFAFPEKNKFFQSIKNVPTKSLILINAWQRAQFTYLHTKKEREKERERGREREREREKREYPILSAEP